VYVQGFNELWMWRSKVVACDSENTSPVAVLTLQNKRPCENPAILSKNITSYTFNKIAFASFASSQVSEKSAHTFKMILDEDPAKASQQNSPPAHFLTINSSSTTQSETSI